MYKLTNAATNEITTSAQLSERLGKLDLDDLSEFGQERMRHMVAIEEICARGIKYSNQDFDVLSAADSFIKRIESRFTCEQCCKFEDDCECADFEWSATYCIDDNKLRLYYEGIGRFTDEDKERIKSAGYRWASKQECYVCPSWNTTAEDMALEMAGAISPEEYGPEERAADRAERFSGYRDKRADEASGFADSFESGPAVHGYQSQARADRAARRHDRQRVNAVSQWNKAEYWQSRTAGVISNALYKASPDVRRRRILKLEKEQRKHNKSLQESEDRFNGWLAILNWIGDEADQVLTKDNDDNWETMNKAQIAAYRLANSGYGHGSVEHPDFPGFYGSAYNCLSGGSFTKRYKDDEGRHQDRYVFFSEVERDDENHVHQKKWTPREVAFSYVAGRSQCFADDGNCMRWKRHYENRLTFENAMLENEGGKASEADIVPGGFVNVGSARWHTRDQITAVDGWAQVLKVNKSPATKRVTSVEVAGWTRGFSQASGYTKEENWECRHKINIESSGSDVYRAPTTEELTAFKAEQKKAKAKAKKNAPKKPKLINPDEESARRLQALWNDRALKKCQDRGQHAVDAFKPEEIREVTQAEYSANSKGSYAYFGTIEIVPNGEKPLRRSRETQDTVCKIRRTGSSGSSFLAPDRVIVITDKPRKPLPLEWAKIEGKTADEARAEFEPLETANAS